MKFTTKQMRSASVNLNAPRAAEMLLEATRVLDKVQQFATNILAHSADRSERLVASQILQFYD